MAYADQQMSTRRIVAIGIVALLHAALGYAFITGLAYNVIKKMPTVLETFDVQEAKPPEEEPPPPPPPEPEAAPPPVAPPPEVQVQTLAPPPPVVMTVPKAPVIAPAPVITPPAPPAKPRVAQAASPRGNRASWITTDDYPGSAQRAGEQGTTAISVQIDENGRVTSCNVTGSSGSPTLDDATCKLYQRRARFKPAEDAEGNKIASTYSDRVRWQLPRD